MSTDEKISPAAVAQPSVPAAVLMYVHAYGDSRADDDGKSAQRLAEAIASMREWAAALNAPAPVAQQPLTPMQAVILWGHRSDGPSTAEIVSFASAVERTCAEAWGVKLAQEGGAA